MESLIYTALQDIAEDGEDEIHLTNDLSLIKPNDGFRSGTQVFAMGQIDIDDHAAATRYLVCKHPSVVTGQFRDEKNQKGLERFYSGLMAIQIIKPVRTLGYIYSLRTRIESRPRMEPGSWAVKKRFDDELLKLVPKMIGRIQEVKDKDRIDSINALVLLQLGLEHLSPLVAGLLWVMGLEALFNSCDRNNFKKKLCDCLGEQTLAFPAWSKPGPAYTVSEIAIDLYMLRNKLAHGRDLKDALKDRTNPVDLLKQVQPDGFAEATANAYVLSEAACYLLCQVLQKVL